MTRIAPGLYDDGDGGLHLAVSELLRANGYADTAANRVQVERVAREQIQDQFGVPVTITTDAINDSTED